jgi:histidine triad (HIT) family protein
MNDCLFCKIIKKEIPSNIIFESDNLVAFPDINPSADIHILIVPKKHVSGMGDITAEYSGLLLEIFDVAKDLVKEYNLSDNLYRLAVNGGRAQHVPHLHFHFLGGKWKKMI